MFLESRGQTCTINIYVPFSGAVKRPVDGLYPLPWFIETTGNTMFVPADTRMFSDEVARKEISECRDCSEI